MTVQLYQFSHSVYCWIVRLALEVKGVSYKAFEIDPFDEVPESYLAIHPFGKVPALVHNGHTIFETSAICLYIDEAFDGPSLSPDEVLLQARQNQIMSLLDSYGYWPMVRQVFAHSFYGPLYDEPRDDEEVEIGREKSRLVLDSLENLMVDGDFMLGDSLRLADIYSLPMLDYLNRTVEGHALLHGYPKLTFWLGRMQELDVVMNTSPEFG